MTVTEIIQCPGCSTRFSLPPERVHEGIRRARCFRCETVFDIASAVARLLAPAPAQPVEPEPEPASGPAEASGLLPDFGTHEPEAFLPGPGPISFEAEAASPFARFDHGEPPSLTLGDLEGSEEEILEKTIVLLPTEPAGLPLEPMTTGGYTSAKDAIAKLMGDTPAMPSPALDRRQSGGRNTMDVEATLSALDNTLGATQPLPTGPPPPPPADEAMASTMKLSAQEIQAAMAAFETRTPPPVPPGLPPLPPKAELPPPPKPYEPPPTSQGSDLLKVQVGQETLNNVNIDQVTTWIEEGRVQEFHMVARQFSDNWIEAAKVPALRPVFERKRREEGGKPAELPPPPPDLIPPRKSLFGGLFGRL